MSREFCCVRKSGSLLLQIEYDSWREKEGWSSGFGFKDVLAQVFLSLTWYGIQDGLGYLMERSVASVDQLMKDAVGLYYSLIQ